MAHEQNICRSAVSGGPDVCKGIQDVAKQQKWRPWPPLASANLPDAVLWGAWGSEAAGWAVATSQGDAVGLEK